MFGISERTEASSQFETLRARQQFSLFPICLRQIYATDKKDKTLFGWTVFFSRGSWSFPFAFIAKPPSDVS